MAFDKAKEEIKAEVEDHVYKNFLEKNVVLVGGGSFYVASKWQQKFKEPLVTVGDEDRIFAAVKGAQQFNDDEIEDSVPNCKPTKIDNLEEEGLRVPQNVVYQN